MHTPTSLWLLVAAACLTACQRQNDPAVPPSAARVVSTACPTTTLADIENDDLNKLRNLRATDFKVLKLGTIK